MASVNRVILVGNLGRDPELRYFPDGKAIANVSLATSRTWKDRASGEKKEETTWHTVVLMARLAEIADKYLKKGAQIYVEGRLQVRKWKDKQGVDRWSTEILAEQLQMLGGARGEEKTEEREREPAAAAATPASASTTPSRSNKHFDDMEDDIPF